MKGMLAGLGLAGLFCLPCLLIGGVVSLALIGGTLGAFATNPFVQLAGLALIATAAALRRRAPVAPPARSNRCREPSAPRRRGLQRLATATVTRPGDNVIDSSTEEEAGRK